MSVAILNNKAINNLDVPCVLSDSASGNVTINLKRINNFVYCHVPSIAFTANNSGAAVILTPSITIPAMFQPVNTQFNCAYINNGGATHNQIGSYTVNAPLGTLFFGTPNGAANFNGSCAIYEITLIWPVISQP